MPALGAAGLSLTLAGAASAAAAATATGTLAPNTPASHEITLGEEEVSDVSLATFYVFDKESAAPLRPGMRLAMGACSGCGGCAGCGGCGCWTGTHYTSSIFGGDAYPPPPVRPAHRYVRVPRHGSRRP